MWLRLGLLAIILKLAACDDINYSTFDAAALSSASVSASLAHNFADDFLLTFSNTDAVDSAITALNSAFTALEQISSASLSLSAASAASAAASAAVTSYIATATTAASPSLRTPTSTTSQSINTSQSTNTSQPEPTPTTQTTTPQSHSSSTTVISGAIGGSLVTIIFFLLAYIGNRRGWFAGCLGKKKKQEEWSGGAAAELYSGEGLGHAELGGGVEAREIEGFGKGWRGHIHEVEAPCELPGSLPSAGWGGKSGGLGHTKGLEVDDYSKRDEKVTIAELGEGRESEKLVDIEKGST